MFRKHFVGQFPSRCGLFLVPGFSREGPIESVSSVRSSVRPFVRSSVTFYFGNRSWDRSEIFRDVRDKNFKNNSTAVFFVKIFFHPGKPFFGQKWPKMPKNHGFSHFTGKRRIKFFYFFFKKTLQSTYTTPNHPYTRQNFFSASKTIFNLLINFGPNNDIY